MPLAELPKELEDLIGDLMEQEKDLLDDAADATSGWLDSMDKGVGWGTMDGPIADMSAKGVTGNVLPDSQEVGGRSGEGRTGKSSGQYVQETASGKGGRNTPTRLTQDPFEAGRVKDTSSEPPTGATGGGKISGAGQEGLRGPMPPPVRGELKRVAQLQQQLIDKAQNLDYGLKKYNYPRGELPKTIELMKQVQTSIEQGDIPTAAASSRVVLSNLREIKDVVSRQKRLTRDNSALAAQGTPRRDRRRGERRRAAGVPRTGQRLFPRAVRGGDRAMKIGAGIAALILLGGVRRGRGRGRRPARRRTATAAARAGRRQVPQPGFLRGDADQAARRERREERLFRGRALLAGRLGPVRQARDVLDRGRHERQAVHPHGHDLQEDQWVPWNAKVLKLAEEAAKAIRRRPAVRARGPDPESARPRQPRRRPITIPSAGTTASITAANSSARTRRDLSAERGRAQHLRRRADGLREGLLRPAHDDGSRRGGPEARDSIAWR